MVDGHGGCLLDGQPLGMLLGGFPFQQVFRDPGRCHVEGEAQPTQEFGPAR
jgi:hypothetical protein